MNMSNFEIQILGVGIVALSFLAAFLISANLERKSVVPAKDLSNHGVVMHNMTGEIFLVAMVGCSVAYQGSYIKLINNAGAVKIVSVFGFFDNFTVIGRI